MLKMSYNRCENIHKFGNRYLPSAYKKQVEFRSHFSGKNVHLMVQEIRYVDCISLALNGNNWWTVLKTLIKHSILYKCG